MIKGNLLPVWQINKESADWIKSFNQRTPLRSVLRSKTPFLYERFAFAFSRTAVAVGVREGF
ncbi:hypothetical protein [Enterococcus mundtii]|uniref:hypothetical protein n=1 Tax=Enterococcus mundtii TaxID=53346 RepID=UPI0015E7A626|nr:hypothetical protein [Enterococcus mundtii]